ncbi:MAG: phosphotriesterase [Microbacteriaceae bacterium]|nr:phosphotriesterase [Microbacteriaceae bacterium]
MTATVHTVLGQVSAGDLGVVATREALLSVVPGAQYAYDIVIDQAEVFETLAAQLRAFKAAGGGTIVDATGMFHGRDVRLLEDLSRATGVHLVATTGMGPEENLGGYFLTPQTNPPTPWPAERFAELFGAEVTEGMVVPRVERRGSAGMIVTAGTAGALTATDGSLYQGAARAARDTGASMGFVYGADPLAELELVLAEGVSVDRVLVAGLDRSGGAAAAAAIAERGAFVGIDHVGLDGDGFVTDAERVQLVLDLIAAGHRDRIILSAGATGVAKGFVEDGRTFESVLTDFAPKLLAAGVAQADIDHVLISNPATLLAMKEA